MHKMKVRNVVRDSEMRGDKRGRGESGLGYMRGKNNTGLIKKVEAKEVMTCIR